MAAKYQLEEEKNTAAARTLLQRAIRINSQCKQLWLEVRLIVIVNRDHLCPCTDDTVFQDGAPSCRPGVDCLTDIAVVLIWQPV